MADGFLGRWSQRKQAVRAGKALEEPEIKPITQQTDQPELESVADPGQRQDDSPPPLTLADAQALTAQSNFAPFAARDVTPEVRNAAMKKLFADPHYNVMDRMDVYIDDYSQADPLPESMLRKMASAKFLQLFEDDEEIANAEPPPDNQPPEQGTDHDHTDLRLQPNDATGREEPGRGAE